MNRPASENVAVNLDLSKKWKERFALLKKMGADESSLYTSLKSDTFKSFTPNERLSISFNFLAFLFGPFYYFTKRMWAKSFVLSGFCVLIGMFILLIEIIVGISFPSSLYWIPEHLLFAQFASYDYYRFKVKHETMWPKLAGVFSNAGAIAAFVIIPMFFVYIFQLAL